MVLDFIITKYLKAKGIEKGASSPHTTELFIGTPARPFNTRLQPAER